MQLEAKKFLLDVLTSCDAIQEFTSGKSFDEYAASRLIQSAMEREFEVIGEAKSHHSRLRFCGRNHRVERDSKQCASAALRSTEIARVKLEVTPLEKARLEKFVANTAEAAAKSLEKN